jgi:broad specificity phosphatase PhoE
MVKIIFEPHSTTTDNQAHIASGWKDVDLSELGLQQSKELGERSADRNLDAVFCSDLKRAVHSAEIAFGGTNFPVIQDARLRECNYGDLDGAPSKEVDEQKPQRITTPFANGESYKQTTQRMKEFLDDLKKNYDGKTVMIIGHRATQYGLENLINEVPLEVIIPAPWKWQPGWIYNLE